MTCAPRPHSPPIRQLARAETEIALTALFRRFPSLRLARPPEARDYKVSMVLRGLKTLPLETGRAAR